jgi:hypothetical protein
VTEEVTALNASMPSNEEGSVDLNTGPADSIVNMYPPQTSVLFEVIRKSSSKSCTNSSNRIVAGDVFSQDICQHSGQSYLMVAGPSERRFSEILAHTSLCILCVCAAHVDRWEGMPRSFRQKNVGMLTPDADLDKGTSLVVDERSGKRRMVKLPVFKYNMYAEGTGL